MNAPTDRMASALLLPQPYVLFLGDTTVRGYAKTAFGLRDWAPEKCVGELRLPGATVTAGLDAVTAAEARARGARALVIGVANQGGVIPASWRVSLIEALEAGLDLIAGMHMRLSDIPELAEAARRLGRQLLAVRVPPRKIPVGTGRTRSGTRLPQTGRASFREHGGKYMF